MQPEWFTTPDDETAHRDHIRQAAHRERRAADHAEARGDRAARDCHLIEAAKLYREAGMPNLAAGCLRRTGVPIRPRVD